MRTVDGLLRCKNGHVDPPRNAKTAECMICYRSRKARIPRKHPVVEPDVDDIGVADVPDTVRVPPGYWDRIATAIALMPPGRGKRITFEPTDPYQWDRCTIERAAERAGIHVGLRMIHNTLYVWRTA